MNKLKNLGLSFLQSPKYLLFASCVLIEIIIYYIKFSDTTIDNVSEHTDAVRRFFISLLVLAWLANFTLPPRFARWHIIATQLFAALVLGYFLYFCTRMY